MKITFGKKLLIYTLICSVVYLPVNNNVKAVSIRETDVETASDDNELIGISGKFENIKEDEILNKINSIRKEACQKGYLNPSTGEKLTEKDYIAIKWSSDLEWIAQLRAAEATINESHTRPNEKMCFSIVYNEVQSWAENLAWNNDGMLKGIDQWYEEKNDWIEQNLNAVTGHYESLINPKYKYIGIGSFRKTSGGWYGVAAEFSFEEEMDETKSNLSGNKIQSIEIQSSHIEDMKIKAPSEIKVGQKKKLSVTTKINFSGIMGGTNTTDGTLLQDIIWHSSKKAIATISANGTLNAKKPGKTIITAKTKSGKSLKATITVKK